MITIGCFILCGLAALLGGFIDAISGGGGLLTMPALLVGGVPPHLALATNKVSACMGTTVSLVNYSLHGLVRWRVVASGILFSLAGSWAGTMLALHIEAAVLEKILLVLLPLAMLLSLLPQKETVVREPLSGAAYWIVLPLVCGCIGLYDGFFGPGTGTFLIMGLHWLLRMDLVGASATAKAFNLASNTGSAVSFIWHGVIIWPLALVMGVCLMVGNWAGSACAIRVGGKAVRIFLLVSLAILMLTLLFQFFSR